LNRLITTFDEVPPLLATIHIVTTDLNEEIMVLPLKRVPPKSFVRSRTKKAEAFFIFETRKDSAVHVSLSSSLLVKQPGTEGPTPLEGFPKSRPTTNHNRQTIGCLIHSSE
jgi:hypothetical protein